MTQITIDIPENLKFINGFSHEKLSKIAIIALKEKLERIRRFRDIVSRSKATEKDVEELSNKIDTAMWKYHKNKYNL